jgi:hypothetical protein
MSIVCITCFEKYKKAYEIALLSLCPSVRLCIYVSLCSTPNFC